MTKRKTVTITFCILLVLVIIFNASMCWLDAEITWHKLFVAGWSLLGIAVIPIIVWHCEKLQKFLAHFYQMCQYKREKAYNNRREICKSIVILGTLTLLMILLEKIIAVYGNRIFLTWHVVVVCGVLYGIYFLYHLRHVAYEKAEVIFAILALLLGGMTILTSPGYVGISQDDETHYVRSISLASVFDFAKYEAETIMIGDYPDLLASFQNHTYSQTEIRKYETMLQEHFGREYASNDNIFDIENENAIGYKSLLGTYSIAYVSPAVAIIIAKGLHLPFIWIFRLGKFGILLTYILILYFAIKRLLYGKVLFSALALTPTAIFFASTYSYDWWVTAWVMAGYSYYISVLQREEKMTNKTLICMMLCLIVGIIPKWVYGVLILPLLFLPKNKFQNEKQRRVYYLIILMGALIAYLVLVRPIFQYGLGTGDLRGGEGINATWQLIFLMVHPWSYVKNVLLPFMGQYLGLANANSTLTTLGYLGQGTGAILVLVVLFFLATVDRQNGKKTALGLRILNWLTVLASIAVIITVFYLIYTPAGADTVNGCQSRYLIPLLLPAFYFLGLDGLSLQRNRNVMAQGALIIIAGVYVVNYYLGYLMYL